MAVPSNYAALVTAIDAILTTYGLSLFQVFGGRSTQPSLRELISLRWKLFSMTTPANYATLIAEIDVVIESYGLSLQEVFGGRSTQPTLQELIDLRYELFEVDGGASDPSQITSATVPLTRADGSALQQGDRWYNPSTGVDGFWNGTYWLTNPVIKTSELGFRTLGTGRVSVRGLPTNYSFEAGASQPTWFLHRWSIGFLLGNQSTPSTNYIIFRYFFDSIGTGGSGETGTDNVLYSTQNQALADNTSVYASGVANIAISKTNNASSLGFGITSVGTATWGGYASMTLVISAIL